MVKYVQGDLFKAPEDILAHGCNCSGGFGSGVAAGMAHNHPKSRDQYMHKHRYEGWQLGDVKFVSSGTKWIANCGTQQDYLPRGILHADYPAIQKCMIQVRDFAKDNNLSIAIPKIGCGLAGGNWEVVSVILQDVFSDYDVTVYEL